MALANPSPRDQMDNPVVSKDMTQLSSPALMPTAQWQPSDLPKISSAKELHQAFEIFNQVSQQLSDSYYSLEQRVTELNGQLADVSKQRMLELAEKERLADRLQHLLNLLPGGVILLDGQGLVKECNPVALELLDGDAENKPIKGELWLNVIKRSFAPRSDDGHEVSTKSGRRLSIATSSLDVEPGQLVLLTDLTETRELQDRLAHHKRLSEMGKMVASLAHQLRTPLSSALLYAGHLTGTDLSKQQSQEFSQRLKDRLHNIEQQIQDMLVFAKGKVQISTTLSVAELKRKIRSSVEPLIKSTHSNCQYRCTGADTFLKCNPDVLTGAVVNLVTNAIQAVGKHAEVSIELLVNQGCLHICVSDQGPGLSADLWAKVREPFFTTKAQGTGLGLAVVESVANAHGGAFHLSANRPKGLVAEITLPVYATGLEQKAG